jgi:hypothetical protein
MLLWRRLDCRLSQAGRWVQVARAMRLWNSWGFFNSIPILMLKAQAPSRQLLSKDCYAKLIYAYMKLICILSVIAVHGLGGHAFNTWTEGGRLWLRDFLPSDLPKARVLTFGYDSGIAFTNSKSTLRDFARSLLESVNQHRRRNAKDGVGANNLVLSIHANISNDRERHCLYAIVWEA